MNNYILIGMPGAGKSTIGVVLAKTLGMGFCDIDLIIQQLSGRKLQEILDTDGLEAFLAEEEKSVCALTCQNTVVATGGSVVLEAKSIYHLKGLGKLIYLKHSFEEIESRVKNITTRGIAFEHNQTLHGVYDQRCRLYEKFADIIIDCNGLTLEKVVESIVNKLS